MFAVSRAQKRRDAKKGYYHKEHEEKSGKKDDPQKVRNWVSILVPLNLFFVIFVAINCPLLLLCVH